MGCLYQIEFPSGKKYIGITKYDADRRFLGHVENSIRKPRLALHHAINKYGKENCVVKTLVIANNIEYLKELEIKAIAAFGTKLPNGYNCTKGGDGIVDLSEEIERVRVENIKKKWKDPEHRSKKSEITKKQFDDKEKRDRHSKGLKKYWQRDLYARDKARENYKKGLDNNPDMIEKMRVSLKQYWSDPEVRKAKSEQMKKYYSDPEAVEKNKEAQRKAYSCPKLKAKMKRVRKKQWKNSESIKKLSESQKKRFASMTESEKIIFGRKISEKNKGRKHSEETRRKISEAAIKRYSDPAERVKTGRAMLREKKKIYDGK